MFDTTRTSLKGQLVAARDLGWTGPVYVIIGSVQEAEEVQRELEKADANASLTSGVRVDLCDLPVSCVQT